MCLNKCNITIDCCATPRSILLQVHNRNGVLIPYVSSGFLRKILGHTQFKTVPCCYFPDYYNNGGTNGGAGASSSPSGGPPASTAQGSAQGSYGSYYQNDGGYTATSAAKPPKKKPPMHKGGKPPFPGPLGGNTGSAGGYQSSSTPGQGSYNQYSQGYGQGKKSFNQNQGGAGGYSYSTAYPSQVTGSAGGSQDYSYEGEWMCYHAVWNGK